MFKKGDTLIEVMLAVGIFSMIAISVVAVMNGGTSSAQTALETTLAREEIDAQTEALRYIHDSYINDKNSNYETASVALWREIVKYPVKADDPEISRNFTTGCPATTDDLPDGAFILDTRNLSSGKDAYKNLKATGGVFGPVATYPQLRYASDDSLVANMNSTTLTAAEGIYIIAVPDAGTTTTYDIVDGTASAKAAYYDFYIRTCWYGTDGDNPSTIATVVRLYNPDIGTDYYNFTYGLYDENGNPADGTGSGGMSTHSVTLEDKEETRPGWYFKGYCLNQSNNDIHWQDGYQFDNLHKCTTTIFSNRVTNTTDPTGTVRYNLYATWYQYKYELKYDLNGGSWQDTAPANPQTCVVKWGEESGNCVVTSNEPTRSGYQFLGWCEGDVNTADGSCSGTTYKSGNSITVPFADGTYSKNLKAIWREHNETITIKLTWSSNTDYDAYIYGTNSSNQVFYAYFGNLEPKETVSGVTRILAKLDHDCIGYYPSSYCASPTNPNETFTINTLGGKNYYYSVRNYSKDENVTGATVTISGPEVGTYTYSSNSATGSGRVWNVFAYKNGKIVTPGTNGATTRSSTANISY